MVVSSINGMATSRRSRRHRCAAAAAAIVWMNRWAAGWLAH
jgi:hypothetical protein